MFTSNVLFGLLMASSAGNPMTASSSSYVVEWPSERRPGDAPQALVEEADRMLRADMSDKTADGGTITLSAHLEQTQSGLKLTVTELRRADRTVLGVTQVKASGAALKAQVAPMVERAVEELSATGR